MNMKIEGILSYKAGIYYLINETKDIWYVGSTLNMSTRAANWKYHMKKRIVSNQDINNDVDDEWLFKIIEYLPYTKAELRDIEHIHIARLKRQGYKLYNGRDAIIIEPDVKKRRHTYYMNNRELLIEKSKAYHREKGYDTEKRKEYYDKTFEKYKETRKKYRDAHKEQMKIYNKEYRRTHKK